MGNLPQILVLQTTAILCVVFALPEDWKLNRFVGFQETTPVFIGEGANGEFRELLDLQEVKLIKNEYAVITARNNIYVLDLKEIETGESEIKYSQVVRWEPDNSTTCSFKTPDRSRCNNFVRINTQVSENLFLMCGTNARAPRCREYEWNGHQFTDYYEGEECTQLRTCLLDDVPSLAYKYSNGSLYMATRVGYRRDPTLRRAPVDEKLPQADFGIPLRASRVTTVNREETLPHLATDNNEPSMLNDPQFISAIDTSDKVFIFFKETAAEQFGDEEVTFSRVAQVCKNDRGGSQSYRSHKWTSYFKARLNCSVPGGKPFNFDELRHVTQPYVINGVTTVFAVMTTPENSIWGSAVCAYTVPAIEKAMTSDFMKRTSNDATSACWSKRGQRAPAGDSHPSMCLSEDEDTRTMAAENLRFRRHHPLMRRSVQPIEDQPLFMATQARYLFTAIDAETDAMVDKNGGNITILYIGTNDGRLLKVVPRPFDVDEKFDRAKQRDPGTFVEEWKVYDAEKCGSSHATGRSLGADPDQEEKEKKDEDSLEKVKSVTTVKGRNIVLVAFRNCVVAVPKQLCANYSCRKECVQSGNPYCGWMNGSCVPVTQENMNKIEQDLYSEKSDIPDCPLKEETSTTFGPFVVERTRASECLSASSFAAPIAIAMSACFILVLLVFFIFSRCKKGVCGRKKSPDRRGSSIARDQSFAQRDASWDEANRRHIYRGPRRSNVTASASGSLAGSRPGSFVGPPEGYGESSDPTASEVPPPYGYASMDSINGTFSRSSSGSLPHSVSVERKKGQGVHVVEGLRRAGRTSPGGPSEQDPNLNNNNMKKNIGIAHALSRAETPVRRRSVPNRNTSETSNDGIRMGLTWGSSAGGSQQREPPCWKAQTLRNPNIMSVSPMPIPTNMSPAQSEQSSNVSETWQRTPSRRSDGMLPGPPANGFVIEKPAKSPKIVSDYNEVANVENRTFRRGRSVNEPYYSETPTEPEYENLKYQRKASTPDNFGGTKPPTPPPPNAKPGRKFSSFTSSHFNSSWFPAPPLQEATQGFLPSGNTGGESSTSGVMSSTSSASVSDTQNFMSEGIYLEPSVTSRVQGPRMGTSKPSRPSVRSTDEGYGSELISSEDKRISSNGSSESDNHHVYNNIPDADPISSPFFNGLTRSPDDENIIKELDGVEWNRQDSKTRTLKKKKTSKKKKNVEKRSFAPDLSSPSDNEHVFDMSSTLGSNYASDVYSMYHGSGNIRQCGQTLDDSFVDCSSKATENAQDLYSGNQYAFHTMRPPGRMRQKLPRLRHGPKESDAILKAVPTPEIPKT